MREDRINVAAAEDQLDATTRQHNLVTMLKEGAYLADARIEDAFRAVPRHLFLPEIALDLVYADKAIPTKRQDGLVISSSSQPTMMAIMLEQLALQPGHRVLEIGAGTGYNAALMAHIVGARGQVVTVDIDEDLVLAARAHLAAAGASTVRVVHDDGAEGFAAAAPYDRIILTVGAWDLAPAWLEQLRPSGRLLLPLAVGGGSQKVVAFERADDHLVSVSVRDGNFMALRGSLAPHVRWGTLFPEPGLILGLYQVRTIDAEGVYAALLSPGVDTPVALHAQVEEIWRGFGLWLATREPSACTLGAVGDGAARDVVSGVFGTAAPFEHTFGLLEGTTLCLLARPADATAPADGWAVRRFGPDEWLTPRLLGQLADWDVAGRPSTAGLRMRAYSPGATYESAAHAVVITRQHTELVLDWP
jgi:protein-L-isoaspartate(D-aspartate) O-methyltransferase